MSFKKYFTLSYDDGVKQDKQMLALLRQYGLRATFNLNSGWFGRRGYVGRIGEDGCVSIPEEKLQYNLQYCPVTQHSMTEEESLRAYQGFEIATHGLYHEDYRVLQRADIDHSIREDKQRLSRLFGYEVVGHAYPDGSVCDEAVTVLRDNGILYARTAVMDPSTFRFPTDPLRWAPTAHHSYDRLFELLDEFDRAEPTEEDLLFCLWGHSYEFDFQTEHQSWTRFEQICERAAKLQNVCFCTNKEAFQHI